MKAGELLTRALVTNFECTGLWLLKKEPKEWWRQILAPAANEDSTTPKGNFELETPRKELFNSRACLRQRSVTSERLGRNVADRREPPPHSLSTLDQRLAAIAILQSLRSLR